MGGFAAVGESSRRAFPVPSPWLSANPFFMAGHAGLCSCRCHRVCARFWPLRSTGRRDWRGAETIGVCARISSRVAEPLAVRASGSARGSTGCLLLADSLSCWVRDSFFINIFGWRLIRHRSQRRKTVLFRLFIPTGAMPRRVSPAATLISAPDLKKERRLEDPVLRDACSSSAVGFVSMEDVFIFYSGVSARATPSSRERIFSRDV